MAHRNFLIRFWLSGLLCLQGTVSALKCQQCKNYDSFLVSPQLNTRDCRNSSTTLTVDCPGKLCVKFVGALYGSASAVPQPNTLDGIQRGCASDLVIQYLKPESAAYGPYGSCQKGVRMVPTPYFSMFGSNLVPTYTFDGIWCFCAGDNCNAAVSLSRNIWLIMSSFVAYKLHMVL
ncbi:uncharacterized protein LOC129591056 [Paramacrobiotus metropolitanus]|uniref:uncharacterized protein LOC129591056 n=1 Tax=Paramacrobiotus metropolitanus TaxID=2943436 RepID=UPI0024465760|nr:uncharacterized protein LOC129591056 [Paramacrobiotus metropolitanus]